MPRPAKARNICNLPIESEFGPMHRHFESDDVIRLHLDEYETIRLIDLEKLTQEECAAQMNIARTTVQGIYEIAREKIAKSIVLGLRIKIEGGSVQICTEPRVECKNRGCHQHGRTRKYRNEEKI